MEDFSAAVERVVDDPENSAARAVFWIERPTRINPLAQEVREVLGRDYMGALASVGRREYYDAGRLIDAEVSDGR